MTVSAPGFKRLVRDKLELRMSDTMAINAVLEVGAVSESVEVSSAATLLQTETSSTGQIVNGDYFYTLPIYQRLLKSVLYFTPGVTSNYSSNGTYAGQINTLHINGGRSSAIGYFEDGVLATSTAGDGLTSDTIMNSVDEMKVLTTALPAEYGHSAGGAITVVKKTGTNQFHGLLSEFGRTRSMTHRKYFDKYRNAQIYPGHPVGDSYWFQMPDVNVSGPVLIPKLYNGRNKTFFMVGYQVQMEAQAKQAQYTVPDEDMKNGIFTFGGIGQPIFDPRTTRRNPDGTWARDPFPGNIVPRAAFDPVAVKILSYDPYRHANIDPVLSPSGPTNNLQLGPINRQYWPSYTARLDQQFGSNLKSFLSWTYNYRNSTSASNTVQYKPFDPNQNRNPLYQSTYSWGTTWVASPSIVAETRLGYYRRLGATNSPSYKANIAALLGIPGLSPDTFPGGLYGIGQGAPSSDTNETMSFKEDVTMVRGKHAIKAGYELMRYRGDSWDVGSPSGNFNFVGTNGLLANGTAQPNTGNSFAAFLIGTVASASFSRRLQPSLPREFQHSGYVQDDWKITPQLTLNMGLRYSWEQVPAQKYGITSIWDPTAPDPNTYVGYTCPAAGCKGAWVHSPGGSPYQSDKNNFQPRLGLAWHPLQRLVIRTGFALTTLDQKFGFNYTDELLSDATTQTAPTGDPRGLYQISQGPGTIVYPPHRADGSVPYVGTPGGHSANLIDPNLQNPYSMNWNFGLQYEVSRNYVVEALYSGSAGIHLNGGMETNTIPFGYLANDPVARTAWIPTAQFSRPIPNWGNLTYNGNYGHSTHHEATIKIEKRYSKGLNFMGFYTFAKSIDGNVSNMYLSTGLNKARSDFDQRHQMAASMNYEIPIGKGRRFLNRGGWLNILVGDFDFVSVFNIHSGAPLGLGISGANTLQYPGFMPNYGNAILLKRPALRDNWQDLGGDRFNAGNQNGTFACGPATSFGNDCFTYIPSYSMGNNGRNLYDMQRTISFSISASKEIPIRERLHFVFRYDFQNPFKWYNWNAPTTTLNLTSPTLYGKVAGDAGSASQGGQPLMNLSFALRW